VRTLTQLRMFLVPYYKWAKHACPAARACRGAATAVSMQYACSICMRGPERLPLCENEVGWSVHKTCVEAAGQGLSRLPRPRPLASGIYVHACPRSQAGVCLGRRDRPRQYAERSMFCARMTLPRFHERINVRTGPSCIQHRRDLQSSKMHERTRMHQQACCIILVHE